MKSGWWENIATRRPSRSPRQRASQASWSASSALPEPQSRLSTPTRRQSPRSSSQRSGPTRPRQRASRAASTGWLVPGRCPTSWLPGRHRTGIGSRRISSAAKSRSSSWSAPSTDRSPVWTTRSGARSAIQRASGSQLSLKWGFDGLRCVSVIWSSFMGTAAGTLCGTRERARAGCLPRSASSHLYDRAGLGLPAITAFVAIVTDRDRSPTLQATVGRRLLDGMAP